MLSAEFIVNPISGGKDKSRVVSAIGRYLDASRFDASVVYTEHAGHGYELARASGADVVVAVGGDGTVSEVARGLVGTSRTFGIIPCGSGDGLALHLGLSRSPESAVKTINALNVINADVAYLNDSPFFCTAGFGLDASVALDFAKSSRRGLGRYISLAWEEWKEKPLDTYRISSPDGILFEGEAVFVVAANANQWGNQARIAPMASLTDGLLDLVVIPRFSTLEIPDLVTRLMTGHADSSHRFLHWSGPSFRSERAAEGAVHFDGDPFEAGTDFTVSVRPGALKVIASAQKRKI